jgi:DNA-binding FadR family transcriptional regulator
MLNSGPLRGQKSLTEEVAEVIATQILAGELQSNHRLPTVDELAARFGVSRTVIRETVALLKAEGLIVVRHGSGMFVASDPRRRPLRIDPNRVTRIRDIVEIMQVRLGLEVEAAGLAAASRTSEQLRRIEAALNALGKAAQKRKLAVEEDRHFHSEIAAAAGNPYFSLFLEFLGRYIIPRGSIRIGRGSDEEKHRYLAKLVKEHESIYAAIKHKDAEAARRAMRRHLRNGLVRLEQLKPDELEDAERLIEAQSPETQSP